MDNKSAEIIVQNSAGAVAQSPRVHDELIVQNSAGAVAKSSPAQNTTTELILRGFLEVVSQMRTAQKEYFRTRDKTALINSKNLEKQIDIFINEFLKSNHITNAKENNS